VDDELTLDGNAIGGVLGDVFGREVTSAAGRCRGCGAVEAVGALVVYLHAPGTVVRCPHCQCLLMRVLHDRGRYRLDFGGLLWLELDDGAVATTVPDR
jgi:hypothetical protein